MERQESNPFTEELLRDDRFSVHGPVHHILVGPPPEPKPVQPAARTRNGKFRPKQIRQPEGVAPISQVRAVRDYGEGVCGNPKCLREGGIFKRTHALQDFCPDRACQKARRIKTSAESTQEVRGIRAAWKATGEICHHPILMRKKHGPSTTKKRCMQCGQMVFRAGK